MKNSRKKREPKLVTWGNAWPTVSNKARIPLAIFKSFKTGRENGKREKHGMLDVSFQFYDISDVILFPFMCIQETSKTRKQENLT